MIRRNLEPVLRGAAGHYPVTTLTGPRQSGKTTLCRAVFPDHRYISLEAPDDRAFAREDPRGLLAELRDGAVIDEVQHVPELLSYLQVEVDERPDPGRFVVTGSQHFGLSAAVAQTLAGRTAVLHLLPPSYDELLRFPEPPRALDEVLWTGAYPRIHDRNIPADRWLRDYVATWVQRDVRQVLNVGDLVTFERFLGLCAARTAGELNLSDLGSDAGTSHNTARAWLSVLETCFLVHRVGAWHGNLRKRLVKRPKLHFVDSGLLCFLLGIRVPEQLSRHPLRGAIFESWVASELFKQQLHAGLHGSLMHLRADRGVEIDLLLETGTRMLGIEVKSGATVVPDHTRQLRQFAELVGEQPLAKELTAYLVYGGDQHRHLHGVEVLPWSEVQAIPASATQS
jgi:predicted AAA+ superfamily ATPase